MCTQLMRFTVQKNFVKVVRATELLLGIPVPGESLSFKPNAGANFTSAVNQAASSSNKDLFTPEVLSVLRDSAPLLLQIATELAIPAIFDFSAASSHINNARSPLVTKYIYFAE